MADLDRIPLWYELPQEKAFATLNGQHVAALLENLNAEGVVTWLAAWLGADCKQQARALRAVLADGNGDL